MSRFRPVWIAHRGASLRLALALALFLAAPGGPAHAQDTGLGEVANTTHVAPDTSEVLAAANAFLGAFNRLEWEPFHAAFQPDATVFQPFREPFRNEDREEIATFFGSFFDQVRAARDGPPYLDIVPEDLRIDPLGEAAVVTFHLRGETEVGRRTLVFGRDEGDGPWRIAHLHASSLERPARGGEAEVREQPPSDLLELNREILRRMIEERDPALLRDVALDPFLVVAPGGRVENLSQAVAGVESFSADATIEISDERVVRHGETAVVIGKLVIDGEMRPVGRLPPMKFATVFVRAGDRWRLLARSLTPCFEIAIQHGFC